jgi:outer membrane protein assembly factor BamB
MKKYASAFLAAALAAAGFACRATRPNLAPRPEPLGFPLMEDKSLPFAGTAVGPIRVRYGVAYFSTDEGFLYSVDALSPRILWRFKADKPLAAAPEIGEDSILARDEGSTIYVLDEDGRLAWKTTSSDPVTTAVRERGGRIYFGCAHGRIVALDAGKDGQILWRFESGSAVRSGPAFSGSLVYFGSDDGRLFAFDGAGGEPVWTFRARGAVLADPAVAGPRVLFGTGDRYLYCLSASTGKKKWAFRPGGALSSPACVSGKRAVFAGADSVVYCVSAGSGEILWWRPVPARILHAPMIADGVVLVSSLSRDVLGFELGTGLPVGKYTAASEVQNGALWSTPYVLVIEADPESSAERLVFLKRDRRPVNAIRIPHEIRR